MDAKSWWVGKGNRKEKIYSTWNETYSEIKIITSHRCSYRVLVLKLRIKNDIKKSVKLLVISAVKLNKKINWKIRNPNLSYKEININNNIEK